MERDTRNGTAHQDPDDEYTNIYFSIGERQEIASFRSDQVTNKEIRELFRSAAEAGPLDIVKLRKGDKILNISLHLPSNTPDDPYILQIVGIHPASTGMVETDLLRTLERRVATLERQLRDYHEAASTTPCIALQELKTHVDTFRHKLETIEHLSWLGFYKQLPEPISSEACRRLQYRRKSDSVKRRVREKFLNICDVAISSSVREWLRSPSFDARQWEDEELLLMLQTMFIELDLPQKFNISMATLRNFLYEVYNNYNEVPFHNFRHCFCVAQMMYAMAWAVDLPTKIGHLEVLVLIVSSICHDLDHPGYNNIYQINARTELALRYNDISPLENHHCSVAFRVLESPECNILSSLDSSTYRTVREGIIRCILATDMARHNEILGQFTEITPEFDYSNIAHINLLSMVLIKVADISNEARPLDVAEPWLDNLLQEFFKQSDAEKLEGLPVTPFMDRDKVTKPSSQVSFIGLVLMPLFEALGELFTELQELIVEPVRYALDYYRRLNEAAKDERHQRKSIVDLNSGMGDNASGPFSGVSGSSSHSVVKSSSSHSMRSKRSGGTVHSRSRSTEEDAGENLTIEEIENIESSDPETATEVEVSEKTLKFKISTEVTAPSTGRKSYPGSRKGSREKSSLDYQNHELAKAMREHERRKSRADNLNSNLSSPVSARSNDDSRILEELERDEILYVEAEGNGQLPVGRRSIGKRAHSVEASSAMSPDRCCCDDKTSANHRSLFSRLRNLTDRLSMSFDTTKEPPVGRPVKLQSKSLSKCNSIGSPSAGRRAICKRCNLVRVKERSVDADKRSMTLPKTRRAQDCLNKSWRTVFVKERRPSISLEVLPTPEDVTVTKHRRNLSNPEGNVAAPPVEFHEIDVRTCKPEILVEKVNPGSSGAVDGVNRDDDLSKVEIRRSSASMEDISKITKQNELTLSSLDQKKVEDLQHTGSLDSMLQKESIISKIKKPTFSSPVASKKSSPSLFSRFKSGMSIDGSKSHSNSSSLHDQQSPSGWISSLTASFRPKRQASGSAAESTSASPHPPLSPNHEEVK